jgi:hypothetical protein
MVDTAMLEMWDIYMWDKNVIYNNNNVRNYIFIPKLFHSANMTVQTNLWISPC